MTTYTVDLAQEQEGDPIELVLVQFNHRGVGAVEFRERLLTALDRHHKQLNISAAHYYDDAIWIYSNTDFSTTQLKLIESLAEQCASGRAALASAAADTNESEA